MSSVRNAIRSMATAAAVFALGSLSACSSTGTDGGRTYGPIQDGGGSSKVNRVLGGCPPEIQQLVGDEHPKNKIAVATDGSRSFIWSPASKTWVLKQVDAVVAKAIDTDAALEIAVFTTSVTTIVTVVDCPTMAVAHQSNSVIAQRRRALKAIAQPIVEQEMAQAISQIRAGKHPRGTSVIGGFLWLESLAQSGGSSIHRDGVMFSDAQGLPTEADLPVDLSGYEHIGIYGVGRSRSADTTAASALTRTWEDWLVAHGIADSVVTSGTYQPVS